MWNYMMLLIFVTFCKTSCFLLLTFCHFAFDTSGESGFSDLKDGWLENRQSQEWLLEIKC